MNKPIGYFLSNTQDAQTLQEIATTYGDRLEVLDRGMKALWLVVLTEELSDRHASGNLPPHVCRTLRSLSDDALLGLVSAIAGQLREGK